MLLSLNLPILPFKMMEFISQMTIMEMVGCFFGCAGLIAMIAIVSTKLSQSDENN